MSDNLPPGAAHDARAPWNVIEVTCPGCGGVAEVYPGDTETTCDECGAAFSLGGDEGPDPDDAELDAYYDFTDDFDHYTPRDLR